MTQAAGWTTRVDTRLTGPSRRQRALPAPAPELAGESLVEKIDGALPPFLGWFSIGLGLAEVLMPRQMARCVGLRASDQNVNLLRLYGFRELATGVGLLVRPRPAAWLWGRVAGDLIDLATLGKGFTERGSHPARLAAATTAIVGITALDAYAGVKHTLRDGAIGRVWTGDTIKIKKAITINRPVEELYGYWRNFENLPRVMRHLESVEVTGPGRSHWRVKAPAGQHVEWDAEITADHPNQEIAWRSVEGSQIEHTGSVRFVPAPAGQGTEMHIELSYQAPAGKLGQAIAKLFGEAPDQQIHDDLRLFKQVMETGEIVRSEASPDGPRRVQYPAQPRRDV